MATTARKRKEKTFKVVTQTARLLVHYKDWEYAERQHQLGMKSVSSIADEIGVPKEDLFDYLSKEKIVKGSLADKISDRTNNMLAADALPANGQLPVTEEDIISINATLQASLILTHRQDVGRARRLVMQMLHELEYATDSYPELVDLGELMRNPDDKGVDKLNDTYQKVISLTGRVDNLKKIGEALKILIALERQAFGIREDFEDPKMKQARIEKGGTGQQIDNSFRALADKFRSIVNRQEAVEDAVIIDAAAS